MNRCSYSKCRYRLPSRILRVLSLLTLLFAIGSCNSASTTTTPIITNENNVDSTDHQPVDVWELIPSICAVEPPNGRTHPAMQYINPRRKKCKSKWSKFRLDYPITEDTQVVVVVFQKDCLEKFPEGEEAFRMGVTNVEPSHGRGWIEFYAARGVVGKSPLQEFCLRTTVITQTRSTIGKRQEVRLNRVTRETNISTEISYLGAKHPGNQTQGAVTVVVESIDVGESHHGASAPTATAAFLAVSESDAHNRGAQSGTAEL